MVWTNIFLLSLLLIWIYSRFKSSVFISDINHVRGIFRTQSIIHDEVFFCENSFNDF